MESEAMGVLAPGRRSGLAQGLRVSAIANNTACTHIGRPGHNCVVRANQLQDWSFGDPQVLVSCEIRRRSLELSAGNGVAVLSPHGVIVSSVGLQVAQLCNFAAAAIGFRR